MTVPDASRATGPPFRPHGPSARVLDILLGVAVTGVLVIMISAGFGGETEADALAYLWAAGLGALMLVRRRYPILVLAISVLGLFAYYSFGYPAVGVAVPVAAALFSAAEGGRLRWAAGGALVVITVSVAFRLAEGQDTTRVVGYELAGHVLLMAAAIALGDSLRSRRRTIADAERLLQLTAADERRRTAERARAEREAIARDLHDALGHRTTVISLHADVGREALDRGDSAAARAALDVVTESSQAVLSELRRTVRLLRSPDDDPSPAESLAGVLESLPELLGPGTGLTTSVQIDAPLPGVVDAAAARILQESAVNVLRHAGASRVNVSARLRDGTLALAVVDHGSSTADTPDPRSTGPAPAPALAPAPTPALAPEPASAPPPGYGIVGMRERAEVLGGTLEAGPEGDGFAVRATLPLSPRDPAPAPGTLGDAGDFRSSP